MAEQIKTIIAGGTYDPVHIGHMQLAEDVLQHYKAERLILVPSFISPHKKEKQVISPEHRIRMLEMAVKDSRFIIETCEIDRGGVSYTIDTIRFIRKKYNLNDRPGLLIGDDLVNGFKKWKCPEEIASEARLIIADRGEGISDDFKFEHITFENLFLEISSSDIRSRIKTGRACRFLMPDGVYEYILENKLYGDS